MNHMTDECFLKHEYPPWYKFKNNHDYVVNNVVNHNKNANITNKTDKSTKRVKRICNLHKIKSKKS